MLVGGRVDKTTAFPSGMTWPKGRAKLWLGSGRACRAWWRTNTSVAKGMVLEFLAPMKRMVDPIQMMTIPRQIMKRLYELGPHGMNLVPSHEATRCHQGVIEVIPCVPQLEQSNEAFAWCYDGKSHSKRKTGIGGRQLGYCPGPWHLLQKLNPKWARTKQKQTALRFMETQKPLCGVAGSSSKNTLNGRRD